MKTKIYDEKEFKELLISEGLLNENDDIWYEMENEILFFICRILSNYCDLYSLTLE